MVNHNNSNKQHVTKVVYRSPDLHDEYFVLCEPGKAGNYDSSVPLVDVLQSFHVYINRGGVKSKEPQNASNRELEEAFGSHDLSKVAAIILKEGTIEGEK